MVKWLKAMDINGLEAVHLPLVAGQQTVLILSGSAQAAGDGSFC